jgi:hypothetical protein
MVKRMSTNTTPADRTERFLPAATAVVRHSRLGVVTIPGPDRPAGYEYLEAWEEAVDRICVAFQLDGWTQPEVDYFSSWAEAYAAHSALAR